MMAICSKNLLANCPARHRRPVFGIDAHQQRVNFKAVNFNPKDRIQNEGNQL